MKTYYYQLLRYIHDQFTGEFVNLGVVVYSPEEMFLKAKVTQRYTRITSLFPESNGKFVVNSAKFFENQINHQFAPRLKEIFSLSSNMESITSQILKRDDSALQLTEVKKAIDIDLDAAVHGIFSSIVERYLPDDKSERLGDEEVWKKKYKYYFDHFKVSERLSSHAVQTQNDVFHFDKAWKNEIWHCYEPVSFDLKREDTVKDKVYRWVGKIRELSQSDEKVHLTFMTMIPSKHNNLVDFVKTSLETQFQNIEVEVVTEIEAESLAKRISTQMEWHDSHS